MRRRSLLSSDKIYYVDLALPSGLLWSTKNVGAKSEEESGLYFFWGDGEGHVGGTYNFSIDNWENSPGKTLTGSIPVNATYDGARANLGEPWRMPTSGECQELIDNTDHEWVTDYNGSEVAGVKLMKKTDNNVYIFIPLSGRYDGLTKTQTDQGKFWLSDNILSNSSYAFVVYLYNGYKLTINANHSNGKRMGIPIRAVKSPSK